MSGIIWKLVLVYHSEQLRRSARAPRPIRRWLPPRKSEDTPNKVWWESPPSPLRGGRRKPTEANILYRNAAPHPVQKWKLWVCPACFSSVGWAAAIFLFFVTRYISDSMKYFNCFHFSAVPSGSFNLNVHINSTYLFCIFPLLFCTAHVHLNPYLTGRVLDCQLYFALKHPTRIRILKCKNPIKRFASLYGISILVQVRPSEHKNPVK